MVLHYAVEAHQTYLDIAFMLFESSKKCLTDPSSTSDKTFIRWPMFSDDSIADVSEVLAAISMRTQISPKNIFPLFLLLFARAISEEILSMTRQRRRDSGRDFGHARLPVSKTRLPVSKTRLPVSKSSPSHHAKKSLTT